MAFSENSYLWGEKDQEISLFLFLSDNTDVEWAVHIEENGLTTMGTYGHEANAANWEKYGVKTRPRTSIHSHPNVPVSYKEEVTSMGFYVVSESPLKGYSMRGYDWENFQTMQNKLAKNYLIYFPNSRIVYKLLPNNKLAHSPQVLNRYR